MTVVTQRLFVGCAHARRRHHNACPALAPPGARPWRLTPRCSRASWSLPRRSVRRRVRACGVATRRLGLLPSAADGRAPPAEMLAYVRDELQKCKNMEPVYWQRREGARCRRRRRRLFAFPASPADAAPLPADLESRRVDMSNKTYKDSTVDMSYPAPGCGAGPWDGLPPGHKAQPVDLEVATPALLKLGLPATWAGARCHVTRRAALSDAPAARAQATHACSGARTSARRSRAARSGARRRRTPRWRRCATRWRSPPRCTERLNWPRDVRTTDDDVTTSAVVSRCLA